MPRSNEKPFPCKECRFANLERSECYRNPPDNGRPAYIHAYLQLGWGCFAGEPRKKPKQGNVVDAIKALQKGARVKRLICDENVLLYHGNLLYERDGTYVVMETGDTCDDAYEWEEKE